MINTEIVLTVYPFYVVTYKMHLKFGVNKEESPKDRLESKFRIRAKTGHQQVCTQAGFPAVCIHKRVYALKPYISS